MPEKKKNNKLLQARKKAALKRVGLVTKKLRGSIEDAMEIVKQLEVLESDEEPNDDKYAEAPGQAGLNELNHTELVALCQERGLLRASRDIPPEILVQVLQKTEDAEVLGDPVDAHRKAIEKFLDVYGDTVRPQLRCDENHAECPPARVLECFASAPEISNYAE